MNLGYLWDKFIQTGKISDYLDFIKEEKKENGNS